MPVYRLALYAGAAIISVGALLLVFDSPRGILGSVDIDTEQNVEAFAVARNASTDYFDENGRLAYTFKSLKLSHFRPTDQIEDSYTSVTEPDIVFLGNDKPWRMKAKLGRVQANQVITLSDGVELEHESINGSKTKMTTSELVIDTNNKVAYTDEAVTIVSNLGEITAVGMQADMSNKKITLLSRVRGRHMPQKLNQ